MLPLDFYQQDDVLQLSRDLIGKFLITDIQSKRTSGMIVETEAYRGPEDRASHAFGSRRTKRNEVMYHQGGISYVYLCYGIHSLFNIVTNKEGVPHAILIRAIEPDEGQEVMLERRQKREMTKIVTSGPGALSQALGITTKYNGVLLNTPPIWLEDRGIKIKSSDIIAGPRVGVDYAGEDALLPWRFRLQGCPWTS